MNDQRIANYLQSLDDAATDYNPEWADKFPPSFDEWNALRLAAGQQPGDFADYLRDIDRTQGD